jgi:hypothetical protein
LAGSPELIVEKVSVTGVPVGGGPGLTTGFGLNVQEVFKGSDPQLNIKDRLDPLAA